MEGEHQKREREKAHHLLSEYKKSRRKTKKKRENLLWLLFFQKNVRASVGKKNGSFFCVAYLYCQQHKRVQFIEVCDTSFSLSLLTSR